MQHDGRTLSGVSAPNPPSRHSLPFSPQLSYMTIVMTGHIRKEAWRMLRIIKASEFKAKCLALIDEVAGTGDPIVITKNGKPLVARFNQFERI